MFDDLLKKARLCEAVGDAPSAVEYLRSRIANDEKGGCGD